ncbi:MAG: sodium:solute symporter family protein [Verrucomicrobiota bacterium]
MVNLFPILAVGGGAEGFDRQLFFVLFGIYILGMVVLGWWVSRGQKSGDDFLLSGRSVPLLLVLGTTVATMVGTGSSMGAVGKAYTNGWAGALFAIGAGTGLLFLAKFFAEARKYEFMTFSEEVSFYYGGNRLIKGIVGVAIFFASVGWLGAHIMGGSLYLNWIAGIDMTTCKILVASAFTIYVIIGGYTAVVWTDTIQAVVLFVGFLIMGFVCLGRIEAWSDSSALFDGEYFAFLGSGEWMGSLTVAVSVFISTATVPSFRQRIYSSKDAGTVRKSYYWSAGLYLLFAIIPVVIGITASRLIPGLENQDQAFPELLTTILPAGLAVVVLIAGLSAVISSASSDAIAGTSILLRDVFILFTGKMPPKKRAIQYSRVGAAVTSILAVLFTMLSDNIFGYIKSMVGLVISGLFVCCVLGRFWKRSTWQGGVTALVVGTLVAVVVFLVPEWKEFFGGVTIPAVLASLVSSVVVSLLTPPNEISEEEALRSLEKEREAFEG